MFKKIFVNLKDEDLHITQLMTQNSRIDAYLKPKSKLSDKEKSSKALRKKTNSSKTKKNKISQTKRISKKSKRIKKITFSTSRTGRNLNRHNKKTIIKKKKLIFVEDEKKIFLKGHQLLNKTISQKNDNDIDSESDIIIMGVRYLHRKLVQAISKEQEICRTQQKAEKLKKEKKSSKIQDYFRNQTLSFNTPNNRRVSVNDIAYLNSIMSAQRSGRRRLDKIMPESTVVSKNSVITENGSTKFWLDSKQKISTQTKNTNIKTTLAKEIKSHRKGSGNFSYREARNESLKSMFLESPNLRKI